MSALSLNAGNSEFDAAQALLDLQSNIRESNTSQSSVAPKFQPREDIESAAKLFLSCIIASKLPTAAPAPAILTENNNKSTVFNFHNSSKFGVNTETKFDTKKAEEQITTYCNEKQQGQLLILNKRKTVTNIKPIRAQRPQCSSPLPGTENPCKKRKLNTHDVATQTDKCSHELEIEKMNVTIKEMGGKIKSLETQIDVANSLIAEYREKELNASEDKHIEKDIEKDEEEDSSFECDPMTSDYNTTLDRSVCKDTTTQSKTSNNKNQSKEINTTSKVLKNHNVNTKSNEMISIGDGHASVPSRLLRHINWGSYTSATRKLLTAVFSRRVLATHSLTGKPSPAFPNKPAKKKLNPALVNDIVQTVVEKCSVPESVVRTSITTKCADESKMYRTRQKNLKKRKHKINRENIPPETSESEDY